MYKEMKKELTVVVEAEAGSKEELKEEAKAEEVVVEKTKEELKAEREAKRAAEKAEKIVPTPYIEAKTIAVAPSRTAFIFKILSSPVRPLFMEPIIAIAPIQ